ncbi:hypothetical protein ABD76_25880 [Paenibacillus dendritiformis]|nr:hypothetical protein [Paenibacillus dendritiformis]
MIPLYIGKQGGEASESREQQTSTCERCVYRARDDAAAAMSIPEKYRKRLRTTNSQEHINEEVRCRKRVIRFFSSHHNSA